MVSFRLSTAEYDRLRRTGKAIGVTNVSELARVAMNRMLDSSKPEQAVLLDQFRDLRDNIESLSFKLERLIQSLPREID
jgi:hypothetical protein